MSLSATKREQVSNYIQELVGRGETCIPLKIQETFGLSRTTTQRYLRKLLEDGVIRKDEKGYRLKEKVFVLRQSLKGAIPGEDSLFQKFVAKIQHFPDQAKSNFSFIFLEIMNNALEHSSASAVMATLWVSPIELRCVIYDDGVGIFQQIKNFFREKLNEEITLEDAKLQLVSGGFTSDRENHGGEGIYNSSLLADTFFIRSGNLIFARDYEKVESFSAETKTKKKGTIVFFAVHRDTQKTLRNSDHANPDDGFYRVTLPLRLMTLTGTALIARSQARRFTFNFIGKKEVILDFEGITDLGQPFAHEIFKVYRNGHPEVQLIAKNTTKEMDALIARMRSL